MKKINKITFLMLLSLSTLSSCITSEKKVSKPTNLLTYKEISSMLRQYDTTKKRFLDANNTKEDARIINIPLEQLKNYIAYVEKLSREKEIDITGINFIMSAYPANYSDSKLQNYQTFFYMPATTINGEDRVSFDPLHSSVGNPKSLRELLLDFNYNWGYDSYKNPTMLKRQMLKSSDFDLESSAGNKNHMSPPL
ncbi:hypothetical protein DUT90_03350 [Polaribacter sp. WD7]|uniref:hypothetical protein n=1 Tax=Polaribacter sp. WD7 TaxID=2269061 RepID=UPI000DF358E1|nr:hypothetical protein [Polaribacter sp. WD7]RCS27886.1 hypothetical protein DUT90_03350 [Polaribacter sp. WD7]